MSLPFRIDYRSWMLDDRKISKTHNLKSKIYHLKSAFTLIELLVVISIIAILIAVATVSYTNAQQKGRDNKRKSDLKAVQQALELYFQQNGTYPQTDLGKIECSGAASGISWGSPFVCGTTPAITYMNPLPKEPVFKASDNQDYYYNSTSPYSSYILSARLENINDIDYKGNIANNLPCTPQGWTVSNLQRNYCVINP